MVLCKWLHCDLWPFPQVSDPGSFGPSCRQKMFFKGIYWIIICNYFLFSWRVAYSNRLLSPSVSLSVSQSGHTDGHLLGTKIQMLICENFPFIPFVSYWVGFCLLSSFKQKKYPTNAYLMSPSSVPFLSGAELCKTSSWNFIDSLRRSAVYKKHNSRHYTFGVIALCWLSILEFCPENFLQKCNLFWTVTLTLFKFGVKAPLGALVTFCDKALVYFSIWCNSILYLCDSIH